MEDTNNNDNFNFDDFLSDKSVEELGVNRDSTTVDTKTEVKQDEVVSSATEEVKSQTVDDKKTEVDTTTDTDSQTSEQQSAYDESGPVRAPGEPEWRFQYRKEIFDKQREIKNSSTDSEKSALKAEIEQIRKELAQVSKTKTDDTDDFTEQDDSEYVKKSDIQRLIEEREQTKRLDDLEAHFVSSKPALNNPFNKDMFFTYIGETYNLVGKSESQIRRILNMAYDDLFPDAKSKQVESAKNLSKTLDAVDFSGSQKTDKVNPEKDEEKKLVENIKNTSGNDFSWIL